MLVLSGMWQLQEIIERLPEAPAPPKFEDPFAWILWEQVAYLAKEPKRRAAFARLAAEVGLSADAIHHASLELAVIRR